jgi:hypothetical protein
MLPLVLSRLQIPGHKRQRGITTGEPYLDGWTIAFRDYNLDAIPDAIEEVGSVVTGAGAWPDGFYEFFPIHLTIQTPPTMMVTSLAGV